MKKCVWRAHPDKNIEYGEISVESKFVHLRVEKKKIKTLVTKGPDRGTYKEEDHVKEFLQIRYPNMDINYIEILLKNKDQYWLVVNQTDKRANPVLKSQFEKFYSVGDNGVHTQIIGESETLPDSGKLNKGEDDKQRAKNKAHHKKHKK